MSANDDVLSFEEQLRRLITEAVESVEKAGAEVTNRHAYVLGYVMGPVRLSREERRALDARIYGMDLEKPAKSQYGYETADIPKRRKHKCSICGGIGSIEVERTNVATGLRCFDRLPCNCVLSSSDRSK
jgi:hypothetical protein